MPKYRTLCALCAAWVGFVLSLTIVTAIDSVFVLLVFQVDRGCRLFNAGCAVIAILAIIQFNTLNQTFRSIKFLRGLRRDGVPNGVPCAWCNRKEPFVATTNEPLPTLHFLTWIRGSRSRPRPNGLRPDYATDGKFLYERTVLERFDPSGLRAPTYKFRRTSFELIAEDLSWDQLSESIWTEVNDNGEPVTREPKQCSQSHQSPSFHS